jgi:uncharacterized membrane protein SirB2
MIEFYPEVRLTHIVLAIATGGLFAVRGLLVQAGRAALANHVAVRYLSYAIDTALLTAALMLVTMLRLSPLDTPWLALKMGLLVAYVVLGSLALKRAPTAGSRRACFVAAVVVYGLMIGIARSHDPRGWLLWLGS